MQLDPATCFRAVASRDRRFDGRFFLGVSTTGIYCRPGCPARLPNAENVRFFATPAAAEGAGFRACQRCRPGATRGSPAWAGSSTTVARALRLIEAGGLDATRVDDLAARVGVGERQLRRLFAEHLGASPAAVARSRRLHFGRALLDETRLSMTEVALAAGFTSQRRFNEAMRAAFGRTPTELRGARVGEAGGDAGVVTLRVGARAPYDGRSVLDFLAPRAIPGVERVEGDVYTRSIRLGGRVAIARVDVTSGEASARGRARPGLAIALRGLAVTELFEAVERFSALFDVDADAHAIAAHLGRDPRLAPSVAARPGQRVPGAWDAFEIAVRAVLGQQVTVAHATALSGKLVAMFGARLDAPADGVTHLFPEAAALADAPIERIGMPAARAETIRAVARVAAEGALDVSLEGGALERLRGVGPWTAAYVAMRADKDPDAFPASDLALRKAVGGAPGKASAADVERAAEAWRPFRAYAAMHLWSMERGDDE
jgi:AraC family transcriptional regulator of adaptative response / DNA-3-methyladenine glycosylase II